jgi:hypothetical protein
LTSENAVALQEQFSWLKPRQFPVGPSFGFGDRIGLATPGHIRALSDKQVFPVVAQQSVRENARTGRTFEDVLADAVFGVFQEGYKRGFGADADHLKTDEEATEAAKIGYTMFTCDPGDHVAIVESFSAEEAETAFERLPDTEGYLHEYLDQEIRIEGLGTLRFALDDLQRTAVKYAYAIRRAAAMYNRLSEQLPTGFDYEVSVDETETPTTPLEHLLIAQELHRQGVQFQSLALRFVGAMEKGVDWRGDFSQFSSDLRAHAAIARVLGPYRLSLHSGSDKFSLYETFSRETAGNWHVKTAGTSYLVALEVAAQKDPALFREIAALSLARFSEDRKSYHLSADPGRIPPLEELSDLQLPDLVSTLDSRQVFHVAYGSVLQSALGGELRRVLEAHEEVHYHALARHMGRHLGALRVTDNA